MSQLNVTTDVLPPGSQVYQYSIADVSGVVTANNWLSVFNPVNSVKTLGYLAIYVHRYAIGNTSVAASMIGYRTTAASGGTLISPSVITKYITVESNSVMEVRTNNPTVTLLTGAVPLVTSSPPISGGGGNTSPSATITPSGIAAISLPGEGIVFSTASGSTSQVWGLTLVWCEF